MSFDFFFIQFQHQNEPIRGGSAHNPRAEKSVPAIEQHQSGRHQRWMRFDVQHIRRICRVRGTEEASATPESNRGPEGRGETNARPQDKNQRS